MNFSQAGFGFTLLALAAGLSSMLPSVIIRRWNGWTALCVGVIAMMLAYATMAVCRNVAMYDAGAMLLGIGFSLIGAVPGLHILGGWEERRRSLMFGAYLALGGVGGGLWPSLVHALIGILGGWRAYWWFMVGLMAVVGAISLSVIRDAPVSKPLGGDEDAADGWALGDALRTPQFYIIGSGIAATYLVATTVNAFTVSYLALIGVSTAVALGIFSIQSACHAIFPLLMGGLADRIGVKALLVLGLAMQACGMAGLAMGGRLPMLLLFAIGVGGGYGTVFLATTLSLETYFGRRHFAQIFGSNQLFTTISVIGPVIAGWVADATGRFDVSFLGCAGLLLAAAGSAATLRPPERRAVLLAAPAR
jgi:MFS family permease